MSRVPPSHSSLDSSRFTTFLCVKQLESLSFWSVSEHNRNVSLLHSALLPPRTWFWFACVFNGDDAKGPEQMLLMFLDQVEVQIWTIV